MARTSVNKHGLVTDCNLRSQLSGTIHLWSFAVKNIKTNQSSIAPCQSLCSTIPSSHFLIFLLPCIIVNFLPFTSIIPCDNNYHIPAHFWVKTLYTNPLPSKSFPVILSSIFICFTFIVFCLPFKRLREQVWRMLILFKPQGGAIGTFLGLRLFTTALANDGQREFRSFSKYIGSSSQVKFYWDKYKYSEVQMQLQILITIFRDITSKQQKTEMSHSTFCSACINGKSCISHLCKSLNLHPQCTWLEQLIAE